MESDVLKSFIPSDFCRVGGFSEEGKGIPEDLVFFYKHLDQGGKLHKVSECLLMYRYHPNATTFSIHECVFYKWPTKSLQISIIPL